MIARNHTGHRVGECHQKAKLTDAQVRQMRLDHDNDLGGYRTLAKKYNISASSVRDIVNYWTRASA